MAYTKTQWVNNQTPAINATNLNHIEQGIYEAHNNLGELSNKVDEITTYSTTEQVIGKWIDGKPIYRKVINFGNLPNTTTSYIYHNINIETTVRCSGIVLNPASGMAFTMPMNNIDIWLDIEKVCIKTESDRSSTIGIAIIEYTKTTD